MPAFRSSDSLFDQPSSRRGFLDLDLEEVLEFGFERVDCALASAPKEMEAAGAEMSSSDSESDPDC